MSIVLIKETPVDVGNGADEIIRLRQQLAECQKDSARYRWLRNNPTWMGWDADYRADEVDTSVDAAMGEQHGKD